MRNPATLQDQAYSCASLSIEQVASAHALAQGAIAKGRALHFSRIPYILRASSANFTWSKAMLQGVLEVTIGLIFMWLVLSIAVMQIMEWIAAALQWRAKTLKDAIRQMLQDEQLTEKVYRHPLIASLFSATRGGKSPQPPAFIPADKFALALFDLTMTAGTESFPLGAAFQALHAELERLDDPLQRSLAEQDWNVIMATTQEIIASPLTEAAVDTLKARLQEYSGRYPELQSALENLFPPVYAYFDTLLKEQNKAARGLSDGNLTLQQIRLGLIALEALYPQSQIRKSVGALLTGVEEYVREGEQALAVARTNVEKWFNDTMDRLSGLYKRKVQTASFLVGLALAFLLNIDSIHIALALWREPTLRQAIVAQAEGYLQQLPKPSSEEEDSSAPINPAISFQHLREELNSLNLPVGWVSDAVPRQAGVSCHPFAPTTYGSDEAPAHVLGLSVGQVCYPLINIPPLQTEHWVSWLGKVLGLLLSGAAAAQGAPFWFDILKKFVNIRSNGPKPKEQEK